MVGLSICVGMAESTLEVVFPILSTAHPRLLVSPPGEGKRNLGTWWSLVLVYVAAVIAHHARRAIQLLLYAEYVSTERGCEGRRRKMLACVVMDDENKTRLPFCFFTVVVFCSAPQVIGDRPTLFFIGVVIANPRRM